MLGNKMTEFVDDSVVVRKYHRGIECVNLHEEMSFIKYFIRNFVFISLNNLCLFFGSFIK